MKTERQAFFELENLNQNKVSKPIQVKEPPKTYGFFKVCFRYFIWFFLFVIAIKILFIFL